MFLFLFYDKSVFLVAVPYKKKKQKKKTTLTLKP